MPFKKLGLSPELVKSIEELKFKEPSEIQAKTIPLALGGKDVIGGSATGSGKTLAFGANIIEKAIPGNGVQALILTPTRELAEQVAKALDHFSKYKNLGVAAVYGGVGMEPQVRDMRDAEIVVGTPGRLLDHLERRNLKLDKVKFLVLDEADRMLDMGFVEDVTNIIKQCPNERQTFLFSATISPDISHIAKKYMKNPVEVAVDSYVDPSLLVQTYYDVSQDVKFSLLVHLLKNEKAGLVMVFCNTRRNTDFIARHLNQVGIDAMAIHGGLAQNKRNYIMEKFHSSKVYVLVCTDVAARGLDIKGVSHVYNYDVPKTSKEYVHRIGRTARAGKEGKAITIVSQRDYENLRAVFKDPDIKMKKEEIPEIEKLNIRFERHDSGGSGRGDFGRRRFGGNRFGGGGRGQGGRRSGGYSRGSGDSRSGSSGYTRGNRGFGGNRFGGRSRGGFGSRRY